MIMNQKSALNKSIMNNNCDLCRTTAADVRVS